MVTSSLIPCIITQSNNRYTDSNDATKIGRLPVVPFDNNPKSFGYQVSINEAKLFQSYTGLGAALTDSSAYLLNRMKAVNQSNHHAVLTSLFTANSGSQRNAGLQVVRVPISSSDFGLKPSWSLDDTAGDTSLAHFTLAPLMEHVIPALKDILAINPNIIIILSPWSAPAWMKDSNDIGYGRLKDQYVGRSPSVHSLVS